MGHTPLYTASKKGQVEVCELLLNRGADVDMADEVWDLLYYTVI